jgi:hypothetical protein
VKRHHHPEWTNSPAAHWKRTKAWRRSAREYSPNPSATYCVHCDAAVSRPLQPISPQFCAFRQAFRPAQARSEPAHHLIALAPGRGSSFQTRLGACCKILAVQRHSTWKSRSALAVSLLPLDRLVPDTALPTWPPRQLALGSRKTPRNALYEAGKYADRGDRRGNAESAFTCMTGEPRARVLARIVSNIIRRPEQTLSQYRFRVSS